MFERAPYSFRRLLGKSSRLGGTTFVALAVQRQSPVVNATKHFGDTGQSFIGNHRGVVL